MPTHEWIGAHLVCFRRVLCRGAGGAVLLRSLRHDLDCGQRALPGLV